MKTISRIINIALYIIVAISLIASIGTYITKKPMVMSAIRSNSMYPLFQRGDMIIIKGISSSQEIEVGDIVVFKSEVGSLSSKGWVVHRIVGGNTETGYITQGDANKLSDQDAGETLPIKPEWIVSRVVTFGKYPLKIRLIGYIPLWMEKFKDNTYIILGIAVTLAIIIGLEEFVTGKKKKKNTKKINLDLQLIYLLGGIMITIMMATTMLMSSIHLRISYEVSSIGQGALSGSNIGILKVGDTIEKSLLNFDNKGFFPIVTTITSNDEQIAFTNKSLSLKPKDNVRIKYKITAINPGKYKSYIWVGMFYPLLPRSIIYFLAKINFWMALFVISIIPGLPIMLYPIIDNKLRRKTLKELKKVKRKMQNNISF